MKVQEILQLNIGKNITAKISKYISKNGKIKGKNKKQTKALRCACTHHVISKKGKIRPNIDNDGNGVCYCEGCNESFRSKLFSDEELSTIFEDQNEVLQQAKFLATALDAGEETEEYLAVLNILLSEFPKTYRKLRNAAEKKDRIQKKSKGKTEKYNGSSAFGGWHH